MKKLYTIMISGLMTIFSLGILCAMDISKIVYSGASVMPITFFKNKREMYVLLGRENGGPDKGTWDIWGGKKDPQDKDRASFTAGREFAEETLETAFNVKDAQKYISINAGNTKAIVAHRGRRFVIYITQFSKADALKIQNNIYRNPRRLPVEKDRIGWIKYNDLMSVIAQAKRDRRGLLIRPIKARINVVMPNGTQVSQVVDLRPCMVSMLQPFAQRKKPDIRSNKPKVVHIYNK